MQIDNSDEIHKADFFKYFDSGWILPKDTRRGHYRSNPSIPTQTPLNQSHKRSLAIDDDDMPESSVSRPKRNKSNLSLEQPSNSEPEIDATQEASRRRGRMRMRASLSNDRSKPISAHTNPDPLPPTITPPLTPNANPSPTSARRLSRVITIQEEFMNLFKAAQAELEAKSDELERTKAENARLRSQLNETEQNHHREMITAHRELEEAKEVNRALDRRIADNEAKEERLRLLEGAMTREDWVKFIDGVKGKLPILERFVEGIPYSGSGDA
ncbi:hypothetical protein VNI00_010211 [Paramarasmius palmivorus]|uniref:Uncharacterized protein n=1 Tax=Paramarasmius palmivorus TaxID=297713 RepID=A0AAW0BWA4_9AGAR